MKFRSIMRTLVLVAMAMSIGLHWALFQSVAWVGMVADYGRGNSLGEAISMTFDGQHPCVLCLALEAGQKQEKENSEDPLSPHDDKKQVLCLVDQPTFRLFLADRSSRMIRYQGEALPDREERPPVPPPRGAV